MVLTLSLGSCCPAKDSEARTPYKTAGNDFATDSATNFPRSGCISLLPAIWIGQTVTKCHPKYTEGGHWLVPTYILRGFASHIRHLNRSEWRKKHFNEQRNQKTVVGRNAPRNEEVQRMPIFSFILWYPGRGHATYAPVLRLSVGEGWRTIWKLNLGSQSWQNLVPRVSRNLTHWALKHTCQRFC